MNRMIPFLLLLLLLSGCDRARDDMGVVARVNGKPIALSQLEFQHDLLHMDGAGTFVPSVESLRVEYGSILSQLVVLELIEQELERQNMAVTDDELRAEENRVRADYPGDAFEQVLIEEYIDLASWRRQLRYEIARRKFFQKVLRPHVKVDYLEADTYYKNHIKDFRISESFKLVVLRTALKEDVNRAVAVFRESGDTAQVSKKVPVASVNELTVGAGQLSQDWKEALADLPEGEVSRVLQIRGGFEALVLLRRLPSSVLSPTQAYPLVEEVLVGRKLAEKFDEWLAEQMQTARVEVSAHLLEQAGEAGAEAGSVEQPDLQSDVQSNVQPDEQSGEQLGAPLEEAAADGNGETQDTAQEDEK